MLLSEHKNTPPFSEPSANTDFSLRENDTLDTAKTTRHISILSKETKFVLNNMNMQNIRVAHVELVLVKAV